MIQSTRISMGLFFKYFLSLTKIDPGQNYISLPSIKSSTHIALLFMVSMGTQKLKAQSFFIFSLLLTLILFCITTLYNECAYTRRSNHRVRFASQRFEGFFQRIERGARIGQHLFALAKNVQLVETQGADDHDFSEEKTLPFSPLDFQLSGAQLVSWHPSAQGGELALKTLWEAVPSAFTRLAERNVSVSRRPVLFVATHW